MTHRWLDSTPSVVALSKYSVGYQQMITIFDRDPGTKTPCSCGARRKSPISGLLLPLSNARTQRVVQSTRGAANQAPQRGEDFLSADRTEWPPGADHPIVLSRSRRWQTHREQREGQGKGSGSEVHNSPGYCICRNWKIWGLAGQWLFAWTTQFHGLKGLHCSSLRPFGGLARYRNARQISPENVLAHCRIRTIGTDDPVWPNDC